MALYRRGSVTVEAIKASEIIDLEAAEPDYAALPKWVQDAIRDERLILWPDHIDVRNTPGDDGWSTATKKDWIIQRQTEHGELYAIPDKRFTDPKAGYTRVE